MGHIQPCGQASPAANCTQSRHAERFCTPRSFLAAWSALVTLTRMFFQAGPYVPGVLSCWMKVGLAGKYSKVLLHNNASMSKQAAYLTSSSPLPSREMKAKLAEAMGPRGINIEFFLFLFFQPHSDKAKWTFTRYTGGWAARQGSPGALGHLSHFPNGSPCAWGLW